MSYKRLNENCLSLCAASNLVMTKDCHCFNFHGYPVGLGEISAMKKTGFSPQENGTSLAFKASA
jgi:hypothetical protein